MPQVLGQVPHCLAGPEAVEASAVFLADTANKVALGTTGGSVGWDWQSAKRFKDCGASWAVTSSEVRARRPVRSVRGHGEGGVLAEKAEPYDALSMLGDAKVRHVDLTQVDAVAGGKDRLQEVHDASAILASKKPFHVLEHKGPRPMSNNKLGKDAYQRVPLVAAPPHAGRGEPLAGRTSGYHVAGRELQMLVYG